MKKTMIALSVVSALSATAPPAFSQQGVSSKPSDHRMTAKILKKKYGYAPGHETQARGFSAGYAGAHGYAAAEPRDIAEIGTKCGVRGDY